MRQPRGSLWSFYRALNWRRVLRRVVWEIQRDDVFGRAAQLSYFIVFSVVPLLLILMVVLGYIAQAGEIRRLLLENIGQFAPGPGFSLISDILTQIAERPGGGKLSVGILATLWAASGGMNAVIEGLNQAYQVPEARPWWKRRIVAAIMTLGLSLLIVIALIIFVYGGRLGVLLADWFGFGEGFRRLWTVARWPAVVLFVFVAFVIVYRFGPNIRKQNWRGILPGAIFALTLWLLVSFGLRVYLHYFPLYGAVYGSLGAVLILLLWLYLSSAALLIGGELNSEIENTAAEAARP